MRIGRIIIKNKNGICILKFDNDRNYSEDHFNKWIKVWCNCNYYNLEDTKKEFVYKDNNGITYYNLIFTVS